MLKLDLGLPLRFPKAPPSFFIALFLMAASACLLIHAALTGFGPQQDELIWWPLLRHPEWAFLHVQLGPTTLPFLEMAYLGNLKFYLYAILPDSFTANIILIRLLPAALAVVAAAIVTAIALRLGGPMAAAITGLLLFTNPAFLATHACDWGPMALSSFFFALLLYLALTGHSAIHAFAFGLISGLGLWDKLTFAAPLLVAIAAALYMKRYTRQHLLWSLCGLILGLAPLAAANIIQPCVSFSTQTHWDLINLPYKLKVLVESFDGSAVYNYLLKEAAPTNYAQRLLTAHASPLIPILLAALVFTRQRLKLPYILFAASFLAWLAMASRTSLAYSVHHSGLLQLAPELALGLLLAPTLEGFPKLSYPLFLLFVLPVLRFEHSLATQGPGPYWSLESKQLAEQLTQYPNAKITALDWGIKVPVEFHTNGKLSISESFNNPTLIQQPCSSPACIYIARTPKALVPSHTIRDAQNSTNFLLWVQPKSITPTTAGFPRKRHN